LAALRSFWLATMHVLHSFIHVYYRTNETSICAQRLRSTTNKNLSKELTHELQHDFLISQTTPALAKQALLLILLIW
jgi:hypothetical protein